jgi:hypothetical protein
MKKSTIAILILLTLSCGGFAQKTVEQRATDATEYLKKLLFLNEVQASQIYQLKIKYFTDKEAEHNAINKANADVNEYNEEIPKILTEAQYKYMNEYAQYLKDSTNATKMPPWSNKMIVNKPKWSDSK